MREVNFSLRIFDPAAPAQSGGLVEGGLTVPTPFVTSTPAPNLWREVLKADAAQATPIRSLLSLTRAGLVRAVIAKSAVPVSDDQVASVIDELLEGRPFIVWLVAQLRDGGLEKLVALILDLLKLAA